MSAEISPLMVSIRCATYNHVNYIRKCLDGFVSQKTNFRFEAVVHDDASTDGTTEIVREYAEKYPSIIIPMYEETNQYSKNVSSMNERIDSRLLGKYIAICEGDDYWIDLNKLQKQVDFLEAHSEYSMCFHRAKILKEYEGRVGLKCEDIEDRDYNPNELIDKWIVPTASILAKREVLDVVNIGTERIFNGDIVHVMNCAKVGKIRGMSDVMSVYRVQTTGATYDEKLKNIRIQRYPAHFEFIKDNYPFLDKKVVNRKIARAYMNRRKLQKSIFAYLNDMIIAFRFNPLIFMEKIKGFTGGK